MKPISLTISGFASYAELMPTIYFDKFESTGLFVIAGETGTGKTSIFDAMCFALYGKAASPDRDVNYLACDFAKDGVKSFVEFVFEHQGKTYTIKRFAPRKYIKHKRNGDVVEEFKDEAKPVMTCSDGSVVDGLKEVNKAVEALVQMNMDQFKQIALIAQGEFKTLLTTKTKERTAILRNLFSTQKYVKLQENLREKTAEHEKMAEDTARQILNCFSLVSTSVESMYKEELADLIDKTAGKNNAILLENMLSLTQSIIEEDETLAPVQEKLADIAKEASDEAKKNLLAAEDNNRKIERRNQAQAAFGELENQLPHQKECKEKADRLKKAAMEVQPKESEYVTSRNAVADTETRIADIQTRLMNAKSTVEAKKVTLEQTSERRPDIEKLQMEIRKINDAKDDYTIRDNTVKSVDRLTKQKVELEQNIAKKRTDVTNFSSQIQALVEEVEALKNKPVEAQAQESVWNNWKKLLKEIEAADEAYTKDLAGKKRAWEDAAERCKQRMTDFELEDEACKAYAKRLDLNRAGILAKTLEKGCACPVCGSMEHPAPAHFIGEHVSQEELDELTKALETSRKRKDEAVTASENAKTAFLEKADSVRNQILNCLENELYNREMYSGKTPEELAECLQAEESEVKTSIEEEFAKLGQLRAEADAFTLKSELLSAKREDLKASEEKVKTFNEQLSTVTSELATMQERLNGLSKLPFENWEQAEEESKRLNMKMTGLQQAIERAEKEYHSAKEVFDTLDGRLKSEGERLTSNREKLVITKQGYFEEITKQGFLDEEDYRSVVAERGNLDRLQEEITAFERKYASTKAAKDIAEREACGLVPVEVETLQNIVEECESKATEAQNTFLQTRNRIEANRKQYEAMKAQQPNYDKYIKIYNTYNRLSTLVNGSGSGSKITLEQYIQGVGFDAILVAANRRLAEMSGNQFELKRSERDADKRSENFLNLDVENRFVGTVKPVGNLSGGESFMAALSLALGLSDTISMNLGGIQMDALFIDEGFGTLDKNLIGKAMEVLTKLSEGNKIVGVISHREELIKAIPQQILVEKKDNCSKFTIVCED